MNAILEAATLGFSLAAIIVSVVSNRRQAADDQRSNLLAFLVGMGGRNRSPDFREAQDFILTELSNYDSSLGITRLPRPARDHVWEVGGFYQDLGVLVNTGIINEDLAAALHYTGIKDTWRALEPYIRAEREHRRDRTGGSFFSSFESLAAYVNSLSHQQVLNKFVRRHFPSHSAPSRAVPCVATSDEGDTIEDAN